MSKFSLRSRFYIGSAVLVLVLLINGVAVLLGHASLRNSVKLMQQTDSVNTTVLAIDRDVQELRFRVDRFIGSGHDSLVDEVEKIQQRLGDRIELAQTNQSNGKMSDQFARIQMHLEEYGKQFKNVVKERQIEKDLVQIQLPAAGEKVDQLLESFANEVGSKDRQSRLAISQAGSDFSRAEKLALRYFEDPDSKLVASAIQTLGLAREKVREVDSEEQARQAILEEIGEFQQIAIRAVQATRSYLLLRNVVMAGEASEVSHYARGLREAAHARQNAIAKEFEATSSRVNLATIFSTLVASALSLLVVGRLAVAMLPPITKLTDTFVKLSAGETLSDIPGADRVDEIGQMAKAARVFSDQNLQTRTLLEDSEQLNQTLQVQTQKLELINDELDSFAYVASHDLKSPLRGIRQLATWIEEDSVESLSPLTTDYLGKLKERVVRMEVLLEDLLNYSRVGKLDPQSELVDLNKLVGNIVEITDNPDGVSVKYSRDLPSLYAARAPLDQILRNLIGNAIKHNHRGSEGEITVACEEEDDFWRFSVSDNGPGIDAKDHERAFQMYQRVGDPSVDGSGMGLAIVKKQIEHFGGTIVLESSLGSGAEFIYTWPNISAPQREKKNDV